MVKKLQHGLSIILLLEIINILILNGIINILMEQIGTKVEERMESLDLVENIGTKM